MYCVCVAGSAYAQKGGSQFLDDDLLRSKMKHDDKDQKGSYDSTAELYPQSIHAMDAPLLRYGVAITSEGLLSPMQIEWSERNDVDLFAEERVETKAAPMAGGNNHPTPWQK